CFVIPSGVSFQTTEVKGNDDVKEGGGFADKFGSMNFLSGAERCCGRRSIAFRQIRSTIEKKENNEHLRRDEGVLTERHAVGAELCCVIRDPTQLVEDLVPRIFRGDVIRAIFTKVFPAESFEKFRRLEGGEKVTEGAAGFNLSL